MPYLKLVSLAVLVWLLFGGCTRNAANTATNTAAAPLTGKGLFIEWAQENKWPFDLNDSMSVDSLVRMVAADIGESKVVLLSEGFHNCEEMLTLQYALVKHLVREKGFTVVATESGLPESKYLNEYIHGGDSIPNMWRKSLALLYSEWEKGRALINWLAEHNQTATAPVDYYGADIGGFYRDWEFPFEQIFAYLDTVDVATSQQLRATMAGHFKRMKPYPAYYYTTRFTTRQRNDLALILEELIQTFTTNQTTYVAQSNEKDYEWVLRSVSAMSMAEHYYRNYQHIMDTTENKVPIYLGTSGRELAMAENIKWMLSYKEGAKIIVINHVLHNKTASQHQGEFYRHFTPMGELLKEHLGDELFVIGMVYGGGQYWKTWQVPSKRTVDTIPAPTTVGLEAVMQAISPSTVLFKLSQSAFANL